MKKQINKEPNKPKQYENKSNIRTKKEWKKLLDEESQVPFRNSHSRL